HRSCPWLLPAQHLEDCAGELRHHLHPGARRIASRRLSGSNALSGRTRKEAWRSALWALARLRSVLVPPQSARRAIKDGVDELVPVSSSEALGEIHCLVDGNAIRHLGPRGELVHSNQQSRMLDWI